MANVDVFVYEGLSRLLLIMNGMAAENAQNKSIGIADIYTEIDIMNVINNEKMMYVANTTSISMMIN